jgi:hypothetical protein
MPEVRSVPGHINVQLQRSRRANRRGAFSRTLTLERGTVSFCLTLTVVNLP